MKPKDDDDDYDMFIMESTGREMYANNLFIGINPKLEIKQGYDGGISAWGVSAAENPVAGPLTADERRELADYMIKLWIMFKHNFPPEQLENKPGKGKYFNQE